MIISSTPQLPTQNDAECIVLGCFSDRAQVTLHEQLDKDLRKQLTQRTEHKDITGKTGELTTLFSSDDRMVLVVGLGASDKYNANVLYNASHAAARKAAKSRCNSVANYLTAETHDAVNAQSACTLAALAMSHAAYRYEDTKKYPAEDKHSLESVQVYVQDEALKIEVDRAAAMAEGINACRHLGNNPPNICTPEYMAEFAEKVAADAPNCSVNIMDHRQMERMKMGALLAVGQGSNNKPKMIVLEYQGADKDTAPYALVGKGITFDTGGISLKPGKDMDEMKYDMCGAASVIGTFVAISRMQLPINLTVIVPAVENMPDGKSYRPGDVVTSYSGKTIEVLNTDAEGRMILCDALTYAQEFKPQVLIDLATLTGACVVALGHVASGVMSKHQNLANDLLAAGQQINDKAWQLPLWDEYQKQLDSPFADMKNIGGFPAGTITAGCFLSRFTEGQVWAHIDIAGTAWRDKKEGATGRPVALLCQYLINQINP